LLAGLLRLRRQCFTLIGLYDELACDHLPIATERRRLSLVHRDEHGTSITHPQRHTSLCRESNSLALREHTAGVRFSVNRRPKP
jgi:hypothetical protein